MISFGLRHTRTPKAKENSGELSNLPIVSNVLVNHTGPKLWTGPYRHINLEGETAIVQLRRGRRIFRSTCVKACITSILCNARADTGHES